MKNCENVLKIVVTIETYIPIKGKRLNSSIRFIHNDKSEIDPSSQIHGLT